MAARTTTPADGADVSWVEAPDGYQLGLRRDKIVARNARGKVLASVPKALKECTPFESPGALRDWLGRHEGFTSPGCTFLDSLLTAAQTQASVVSWVWE